MKKLHLKHKLEKGQIIPLVVVMFFVMIAMVALIIDGGALMSNRRTAQAAADAGAMAGAKSKCLGNTDVDAASTAVAYATTLNGATSASAIPPFIGKQVTVNAKVEHPSFFAKIFGDPTLEASAEATAGCFGVKAKASTVFPMSFPCIQNLNHEPPYDPTYDCQIQTLSWKEKVGPLVTGVVSPVEINGTDYYKSSTYSNSIVDIDGVPPEQIYIIFDGDKICTNLSCGYNGGASENSGNRGWLKNINLAIDYYTDTWIDADEGIKVGHFKDVEPYVGQVKMLPIWDVYSPKKYHIVAYAPFYVSCVDTKGKCPGFINAYNEQTDGSIKKLNQPVVEGYFLTDYDVSIDSTDNCSINLGNCTVSLTK